MTNIFDLIKDRGFYYQCTSPEHVEGLLNKQKAICYVGFDLTASSLHVGSLLPIMLVRHLISSGNNGYGHYCRPSASWHQESGRPIFL